MPIKFQPVFQMSPKLVGLLLEIERVKERVKTPSSNAENIGSLRESAKLMTTHFSTMIEGNRLTTDEVKEVLLHKGHFPWQSTMREISWIITERSVWNLLTTTI